MGFSRSCGQCFLKFMGKVTFPKRFDADTHRCEAACAGLMSDLSAYGPRGLTECMGCYLPSFIKLSECIALPNKMLFPTDFNHLVKGMEAQVEIGFTRNQDELATDAQRAMDDFTRSWLTRFQEYENQINER